MRGSVNKFFDYTPIGTLMNRFNNDIYYFRTILNRICDIGFIISDFIVLFYMVASANPVFLLMIPILLGHFLYIYKFTQRTMHEV